MTEENFKAEMLKRGWSEEEIQEFINRSEELISRPLEYWVQDKPVIRKYYLNEDGHIVDEEI